MKIKTYIVVCIVAFHNSICLEGATEVAPLKCKMHAAKIEILPFEPLELVLSLQNTTSETVVIELNWGPWLLVGKPTANGEGWEWSPPYITHFPGAAPPPPVPPKSEIFKPNEERFAQVVSVLDTIAGFGETYRPLFESPGQVAVRGEFGGVLSEPVVITIIKPTGLDAEAFKALVGTGGEAEKGLGGKGLAYFFSEYTFNEVHVTKRKAQQLQEFAEKYQDSVYADYAKLGLGLMHLKGVRDEEDPKRERKKDIAMAENYFRLLAEKEGSVVRDRARYYLAVCRVKSGDKSAADDILNNLKAQSADPVVKFKAAQPVRN